MKGLKSNITLYKFILSYLVIVMPVLLLTNIIFYQYFVPSYESEVETINNGRLLNLKLMLDNRIAMPVENIYMDIISDKYDIKFISPTGYELEKDLWKIYNVHLNLKALIEAYPDLFESVSIYYNSSNFINSSKGFKFLSKDEPKNVLQFSWLNNINFEGTQHWSSSLEKADFSISKETVSVISYLKPTPLMAERDKRNAIIAMNIKEAFIKKTIEALDTNKDLNFYILTHDGSAVFSNTNSNDASNLDNIYKKMKADSSDDIVMLKDNNHITSGVMSENKQWFYVISIPQKIYFSKSETIKKQIVFLTLTVLAAALVLSLFISKKTYTPIKSIALSAAQILSNFGLKETKSEKNSDFDTINSTIEILSTHVSALTTTLKNNIPIMKHNFYNNLIQNTFNRDETNERLSFLNIKLPGSKFKVAIIFLDIDDDIQTLELIRFGIIKYIEDSNKDGIKNFALTRGNHKIVIISNYDEENAFTLSIKSIYDYIITTFNLSDTQFCLSCGPVYDKLEDTHLSYNAAKDFSKYRYILYNQILDAATLNRRESESGELLFDTVKFKRLVLNLNEYKIEEFLDEFTHKLIEENLSYNYVRQQLMQLLSTTVVYLKEISLNVPQEFYDRVFEDYSETSNIMEFKTVYMDFINSYIDLISVEKNKLNDELIEKVKAYIKANITEDLSLSTISDKFHISYSHLSKVFKDVSGKNFSSFVAECKLDVACNLLSDFNLTIDEIALKVGFNDTGYFIKNFKSYYGITPKQYRLKNLS